MSDLLQSVREGRLLHLTLNRPEKRNALNSALCRVLVDALDAAARDRFVGAILLSGNGKAFCAGMDLKETAGPCDLRQIDALHEHLFTVYTRLQKPLIGAIQGAALGGGMGLVSNCHIAVAAPDASFGLTEIRLGLWPFLVYRGVSAALGERRTLELALTGRTFSAAEAREAGLIHEVAADPLARALEIARGVAETSPAAIQGGLSFVQQVRGLDWTRAGAVARKVREEAFGSEDVAEGIRAFLEKRPPRWPSLKESMP